MIKLLILILSAIMLVPNPVLGQTTSSYTIQVETFKEQQKAVKKTESDLVISDITFKLKGPGKETVWIQGTGLSPPLRSPLKKTNLDSSSTSRTAGP